MKIRGLDRSCGLENSGGVRDPPKPWLLRNSKLAKMIVKPRFETLPPEVKFERTSSLDFLVRKVFLS